LRKKPALKISESGVLRRIFAPKKEKVTGSWKNCIMRRCA
jgi:hypothetical protein